MLARPAPWLVALFALLAAFGPARAAAAATVRQVTIDHVFTTSDEAGPGDIVHVGLDPAADKPFISPRDACKVTWGDLVLPVVATAASATEVTFTIPPEAVSDEAWKTVRAKQRTQPAALLSIVSPDGATSQSVVALRLYLPALVTAVRVAGNGDGPAMLGDVLEIGLDPGAYAFLKARAERRQQSLGLWLNDTFVGGDLRFAPERPDQVSVALTRAPANRAAWSTLFANRSSFWSPVYVSVAVGSGDGVDRSWAPTGNPLAIEPWGRHPAVLFAVLAGVVAVFAIALLRTGIARDWVRPPTGAAPYSLGHTQLYVWVATAFLSTVAAWWVTRDWMFPDGLLMALGIGGGTMLGSRVIDRGNWGPLLERRRSDLESRCRAAADLALTKRTACDKLHQTIVVAATQPPEIVAAEAEARQAEADLRRLQEELAMARQRVYPDAPASEGFLRDLLTGMDGDALYRYQLVLWTGLVLAQFWASVLVRLEIPDLDSTRLALMGMSAGTYLGLKLPEKAPS